MKLKRRYIIIIIIIIIACRYNFAFLMLYSRILITDIKYFMYI